MKESVVIGLTGDVMIGRGINSILDKKGIRYVWGNLLPTLCSTDLNIVNLETSLTNSEKKAPKTFNFKATPEKTASLTTANIKAVSLANNHILDFGEEGMMETIRALDDAGIKHSGAGINDVEASIPTLLTLSNITIGLLAMTDNEPGWKAGPSKKGIHYINVSRKKDRDNTLVLIERLKRESDIAIISIHWGPNMKENPDREFIEFAHQMVHHGADIIQGHSAHNFQAIEVYYGKLIFYDMGDFVDDYMVNPLFRNDHSFFYRIEAVKDGITSALLVPVLISNYQVNLATGSDATWSLQRIKELSSGFGTIINEEGEIILKKEGKNSLFGINQT